MRSGSALFVLSLLVAPAALVAAAEAQTVTIRSGEHETFTRLVLAIPAGTGWRLGRVGDGYGLRLDAPNLAFDTRGVFERLPRNRIAALTPDGPDLGLAFNCECHVGAFLWRPDRLVLDIREGPAPSDSPWNKPLETAMATDQRRMPMPRQGVLPLLFGNAALMPEDRRPPFRSAAEAVTGPGATSEEPVLAPNETARSVPAQPRADEGDAVSAAEMALLESVARAAAQGLLKPAVDRPVRSAPEAEVARPAEAPAPGIEPPTIAAASGPGISARSSLDNALDSGGLAQVARAAEGLGGCIAPERLAVADWGMDDTPFHAQIAERRRAMAGQFDSFPAGAARDLARAYLHFGFGREALQTIGMETDPLVRDPILSEMAAIVDGERPKGDLLAGQIACEGPASLWAVMASDTIPDGVAVDRNGIIQAYRELPRHLRASFGATLAEKFIAHGDPDAADFLLRGIEIEGTGSEASQLAEAELAVEHGGAVASIDDLVARARSDARTSPDLLLRIFALSHDAGQEVPTDILELSSALRFGLRGDPKTAALAEAEARALTDSRDYADALALVSDEAEKLGDETVLALTSAAVAGMTETLEDTAFLRAAIGGLPRPIDARTENLAAARLLGLGFPEAALAAFVTPAVRDTAAERRYLRAEAHLALGRAEEVGDILAGMTDTRAAEIRSRALAADDDYAGAYSMAAEASSEATGDPEDAGTAWRAGAWTELVDSEDPALRSASERALAAAMPQPRLPILEEAAPLETGYALLEEVAASREMIADLLTRFEIEDEAAAAN